MIEYTGWVGTIFTMWGIWLIGRKQRIGFLAGILGGVLWTIKAIHTSQVDLIAVEVLIVITQIYAWQQWGKDARLPLENN